MTSQQRLWVMGCYEHDILRLFFIWARTEVGAHQKAGIILRKNQSLWFDSLEEGTTYLNLYPEEKMNDQRTSFTIYDQDYYTEPQHDQYML